VTTDETGSSGICGSSGGNSGRCRLAVSRPEGLRGQCGMVEGRVRRCGLRTHGLAGKGTKVTVGNSEVDLVWFLPIKCLMK
jgi:hypothetical protein